MTIRIWCDITYANGITDHISTGINLPKWNKAAAMAEMKHRYPSAKTIKILKYEIN